MPELPDVQGSMSSSHIPVLVGVRGVEVFVNLLSREKDVYCLKALVDAEVRLAPGTRGTHLSRIVGCIGEYSKTCKTGSFLRGLVLMLCKSLESYEVVATLRLSYPLDPYVAPSTGIAFPRMCEVAIRGAWDALTLSPYAGHYEDAAEVNCYSEELCVEVPVMTVCPCSLAITEGKAAHVQRCYVNACVQVADPSKTVWIEDIADILSTCGSASVQGVLKRVDEKALVESAFANPMFVEDVVRLAAEKLSDLSTISGGEVRVRSQESIHPFDVVASAAVYTE